MILEGIEFFWCEECDEKLDYVLIDGYGFGDRLLEGVMFKIAVGGNGMPVCLGVEDEFQDYFESLNMDYWKGVAEDFALDEDIASCPFCGYDVPIWNAAWDED